MFMRHQMGAFVRVFLSALVMVIAGVGSADARLARRFVQPSPSDRNPEPAIQSPAQTGPVVANGAVVAPRAPIGCPRNICYRHHPGCGCYDPCQKMQLILQVKDPCACCLVEVPVCIPACCTTNPHVCNYKGFLRRQVVEYSWACGFRLTVVFDRCGDITVHYYGC